MKWAFLFYCLAAPHAAFSETRRTDIPSLSGRSCAAYLHFKAKTNQLPLVFGQQGTGIYSTAESPPGVLPNLVEKGIAAGLSLDKPGISPSKEKKPTVEKEVFRKYTIGDVAACAFRAIQWAVEQREVDPQSPLVLFGHSEGAWVVTLLYLRLLEETPQIARRVSAIYLSGAPLEKMEKVFLRQLSKERPEFRRDYMNAFKTGNDTWLVDHLGVGASWIHHAFSQGALSEVLIGLDQTKASAIIEIYQGTQDEEVSPESTRAFEQVITSRRASGQATPKMSFHYFQTGHSLNLEAWKSMLLSMRAHLTDSKTKPNSPLH
jgi:pimeloyl-ACP methyl ester carboxylesterase